MKWILCLMMGLVSISGSAQDNWIVYLNKKAILNTSEESEEKNIIRISRQALKNNNLFTLTYLEQPRQKDWTRSIMVFDSADQEIKRVKGNKLSYSNAALLSLLSKHGTIELYTWSIPNDPALKERIRVRRVHLCTLVLE